MANETITISDVYEAVKQLAVKIEALDLEIHELKEEREIRPEYKEKLLKISKQKGKTFKSKDEFLNYLRNL